MLIFISNTPKAYAWGSRDALPELLGTAPNGEPQAELWLGAHPEAPASVAKASPVERTLIDLIESDPELYGVDGGALPFLLKVLGIGAPLSLQVHPDLEQAIAGFAAEEAAGIPPSAPHRNYGDANHKPELLVALSEIMALCGFRPFDGVRQDLRALLSLVGPGPGRDALEHALSLAGCAAEEGRAALMSWALAGGAQVDHALAAIDEVVDRVLSEPADASSPDLATDSDAPEHPVVHPVRLAALRSLLDAYPGDPGVFVSLLLHLVRLRPGEAIYLGARQLHAYLSGIGVEVMAASDNVLRAGLTSKHVDVAEVHRIVDLSELDTPRLAETRRARGLVSWDPEIRDFRLLRARLCEPGDEEFAEESRINAGEDVAESVRIDAPYPIVLIVTAGRVRVERHDELGEVVSVRRGQSLYVSAGGAIELSGTGEVFLATVGRDWAGVS